MIVDMVEVSHRRLPRALDRNSITRVIFTCDYIRKRKGPAATRLDPRRVRVNPAARKRSPSASPTINQDPNMRIPSYRPTRVAPCGLVFAVALALAGTGIASAAQPRPLEEVEIAATYASIKAPRYPQSAIDAKSEGDVLLRVLVNAEGEVEQVEVETSSGHQALDEAAMTAVRKWKFNAASNGYAAVPSWIGVPVSFSLTESSDTPSLPAEYENALDTIWIRGG
jgi:periplasmic protein TonB